MPKMKTNRSAAKRFKLTGTGKATRGHSGLRHGMVGKSRGRKRKLNGVTVVAAVDQARVQRMLGKR
jgi:large subunit ribosomal protein L35